LNFVPEVVTNPFGALLGAAKALLANKAVTATFKNMMPNLLQQMKSNERTRRDLAWSRS
jgi:hypothetical protein